MLTTGRKVSQGLRVSVGSESWHGGDKRKGVVRAPEGQAGRRLNVAGEGNRLLKISPG